MDSLYRTHAHLIRHRQPTLRRGLMDEIDPKERLIGIIGSRGIGKTCFLLDWAAEKYDNFSRKCLYLNLNQFFLTSSTLTEFVDKFIKNGGETLLLDQIFKYPNWLEELQFCIEKYPSLRIIYTGSPLLEENLKESNYKGAIYHLYGFSLREFINAQAKINLPKYSWEDILKNHISIAKEITQTVNPNNWFNDYVHHGYYPFFLTERTYSEHILKQINMMLEVDIMYIRNIDQKLLSKLRKLVYLVANSSPSLLNVSKLAKGIETSRATVTNYINFLKDAELITLVPRIEATEPKSSLISYIENTNLSYAIAPEHISKDEIARTFFLNQVRQNHNIEATVRSHTTFIIDKEFNFRVDAENNLRYRPDRYYAVNNLEVGIRNIIPLWLFGFLY